MNQGDIVKKLQQRGLSRRSAVRIFNLVLDEMAAALSRGETVEFPFGSLKKVHHAHKKQQGRFLNRDTTIYRKPYTVVLEVNAAGKKLLQRTQSLQELLAQLWRTRPASLSNTKRSQP